MSPLTYLLQSTKHTVYLCSLGNDNVGKERRLVTRDPRAIKKFIAEEDAPKRGLYFCTSTIKGNSRNKAATQECRFLHADIDFKDLAASVDITEVSTKLQETMPPNTVVFSGNGIHAYWFLDKTLVADEAVDILLKRLATVVSGDKAVTHRAALLRLPGSHNTKKGSWKEVRAFTIHKKPYTLKQLDTWLATAKPLFPPPSISIKPDRFDAFIEYGKKNRARIDVVSRLNAMEYQGSADTSIHLTQLSCVASLASRDYDEDEVVDIVVAKTQRAAEGLRWNWTLEERKIRRMYRSWLSKKAGMV